MTFMVLVVNLLRSGPMKFVNLLPHSVTIFDEGVVDIIIPSSGWSLQLNIREGEVFQVFKGVPIYNQNVLQGAWLVKGIEKRNLPSPRRGLTYIVSSRQAEMFSRPDMVVVKTAPYEKPLKIDGKLKSVRGLRRV